MKILLNFLLVFILIQFSCKKKPVSENSSLQITDSIHTDYVENTIIRQVTQLREPWYKMPIQRYNHYLKVYKKWSEFIQILNLQIENPNQLDKSALSYIFLEVNHLDKQFNLAYDSFQIQDDIAQLNTIRHLKAISEIKTHLDASNTAETQKNYLNKLKQHYQIYGISILTNLNNQFQTFCNFQIPVIAHFRLNG
ncbi:MAG: hypothetical protein ACXWEY_15270 [Bacteroidia bacterium]